VSEAATETSSLAPDPEDQKLIILARSAAARTGAAQGASIRDSDGRTYAAASVRMPHLELSAVAVAVAMAVSSGAGGLEAAVVAGTAPNQADLDILLDLPRTTGTVWHVDVRGKLISALEL
jgi:hypothetical protein